MTRDEAVVIALVVAFAALVTAHVLLVAELVRYRPRWRAFVALALPPLAPYWGIKERQRVLPALWIVSAVGYLAARFLASR
jgi:hypothetical protein